MSWHENKPSRHLVANLSHVKVFRAANYKTYNRQVRERTLIESRAHKRDKASTIATGVRQR